jgi:hypothetical protein
MQPSEIRLPESLVPKDKKADFQTDKIEVYLPENQGGFSLVTNKVDTEQIDNLISEKEIGPKDVLVGIRNINLTDGSIDATMIATDKRAYVAAHNSELRNDPDLLERVTPSGTSAIVITSEEDSSQRLVLQFRSNERKGEYSNVVASSAGGLIGLNHNDQGAILPLQETVQTTLIKEMYDDIGLLPEDVTLAKINNLTTERLPRVHHEIGWMVKTNLTANQVKKRAQEKHLNLDDPVTIDIPFDTVEQMEKILLEANCPIPTTHLGTFLATCFDLIREKSGVSEAKEWLQRMQPKIEKHYHDMDAMVRRSKLGYDGYDIKDPPEKQGLPSLFQEFYRLGILTTPSTSKAKSEHAFEVSEIENPVDYSLWSLEKLMKEAEKVYPEGTSIMTQVAHGNEPFILGSAVAKRVCLMLKNAGWPDEKIPNIIVPNIYPGRQERILKEETEPTSPGKVIMSRPLGEILEDFVFKGGEGASETYEAYVLHQISRYKEFQDRWGEAVFKNPKMHGETLYGGEQVAVDSGKIAFVINAGSPFALGKELFGKTPSFYVFPYYHRELYVELLTYLDNPNLVMGENIRATLKRALRLYEQQDHEMILVPKQHTFSWDKDFDSDGYTWTPPLKTPLEGVKRLEREGIYMMPSGTGSGGNSIEQAALSSGYQVYRPSWYQVDGAMVETPDVIYDPKLITIMMRMGWGTAWNTQQAGKAFVCVPHIKTDDPEIYHNLLSIEDLGLGVVLKDGNVGEAINRARSLKPRVEEINRENLKEFGTRDGIQVAAREMLRKHLIGVLENKNR